MTPRLFHLLQADEPSWLDILAASFSIEDAQYVDSDTNYTPLHLAVLAKDPENNESRVAVIRSLLQSDGTATEVTCFEFGYTPLMHACRVRESSLLVHDVPVVKLLMGFNPRAFRLQSSSGHSALEIHIMSMSRFQQEASAMRSMFEKSSNGKQTDNCTAVLNALLENDLGIAIVNNISLLLECNTLEVMEHVAQEEAHSFVRRLRDRRKQRKTPNEPLPLPSGSRNLQGFWVWEFLLAMLKSEHEHTYKEAKPIPPFNALHTASQIDDFPLPFLMLCMRVYPAQVRTPSVVKAELPVHSVAAWDVRSDSKVARKSMALVQLLSDHPTSSQRRNEEGKTPLSLAIETGTAWNSGVRRLTAAQKEDSVVMREQLWSE